MKVKRGWHVTIGRDDDGDLWLWLDYRAHAQGVWSLRWWERGLYALLVALGLFELASWAGDLSSIFENWFRILELGSMA